MWKYFFKPVFGFIIFCICAIWSIVINFIWYPTTMISWWLFQFVLYGFAFLGYGFMAFRVIQWGYVIRERVYEMDIADNLKEPRVDTEYYHKGKKKWIQTYQGFLFDLVPDPWITTFIYEDTNPIETLRRYYWWSYNGRGICGESQHDFKSYWGSLLGERVENTLFFRIL